MKKLAEYRLCVVRESEALPTECTTPSQSAAYWRAEIAPHIDPEKEHLVVLLLNTKCKIKGHVIISIGSVNECLAHPREIFRPLIVGAAHSFVLMHNHPSGDPTPSDADRRLTTRIKECASLIQINFLDHVIIGTDMQFSFRETGVL